MKTPEEMAGEYCDSKQLSYVERLVIIKGFLAGYKAAQQWISVKDRLPDVLESVLVLYAPTNKAKNDYRMECWNWPETEVYEIQFISHWQPLPAPPKEEK